MWPSKDDDFFIEPQYDINSDIYIRPFVRLTGSIYPLSAAGRPRVRQELEAELNGRLLELGIEPGTQRLSSGLMTDKLKHLQLSRQVP